MTTTDTDALRERLAETLHYGQGYDDWGVANDDERGEALALADEVLPVIAAEARKAKAEALREAADRAGRELGWESGGHTSTYSVRHWLRHLATEHETGDSDERR